ncbi:hypothetical protein HDU98_008360, partial [Podochytrium sp. JEL0797]
EFKESESKLLPSILCNVQYFDPENSQTQDEESLEWIPHYIDPETGSKFVAGKVYAMQVTLTNTMAIPYSVSALVTIPSGALAVKCSSVKTQRFTLQPFTTILETLHFYFPSTGSFDQYPIRLADRKNCIVASSRAVRLVVVETMEKSMLMDGKGGITWSYLSLHGTDAEVLEWIQNDENVLTEEMAESILFRFSTDTTGEFWGHVVQGLRRKGVYCDEVWAFGVKFGSRREIVEWLVRRKPADLAFVAVDGLVVDDYVSGEKDVFMYWPLINARAHEIGHRSRANNREFSETYSKFILYLLVKPASAHSCRDHLSLICFLLLQDRFEIALKRFKHLTQEIALNRVKPEMEIQLDYLTAWFDFIDQSSPSGIATLKHARDIAKKHKDCPAKHWNELFAAVLDRVDEFDAFFFEASSAAGASAVDSSPKQSGMSSALSFKILSDDTGALGSLLCSYANISQCEIRFYSLNLEMEFSSKPFSVASRFQGSESAVSNSSPTIMTRPHHTLVVDFPVGRGELTVTVPKDVKRGNVAVEVFALDGVVSQTRVASESCLKVLFVERKGALQVLRKEGRGAAAASLDDEWEVPSTISSANVHLLASQNLKPVRSVYIKVYAKLDDGREVFYKDGYTDILGRFEYASLSNSGILAHVVEFAILASSSGDGDAVFTVKPPKV